MTYMGRRSGDMFKADYDTNANTVVDNSEKLAGSTRTEVQNHTPKSHTHTESEIADLAHNAVAIAGKEVNDAAIGDQKVLAYDDGSGKIIYITPAPAGAALEKIQSGAISITATSTSNTATIDAVDVDKAFVLHNGNECGTDSDGTATKVRLTLTNATTVTATRGVSVESVTVKFTVVEFSSGINSIQRGTITLAAQQTNQATINSVDTAKAFVNHLGMSTADVNPQDQYTRLDLIDATTVEAEGGGASAQSITSFEVVEFT